MAILLPESRSRRLRGREMSCLNIRDKLRSPIGSEHSLVQQIGRQACPTAGDLWAELKARERKKGESA
jgi:hypothetical protein